MMNRASKYKPTKDATIIIYELIFIISNSYKSKFVLLTISEKTFIKITFNFPVSSITIDSETKIK